MTVHHLAYQQAWKDWFERDERFWPVVAAVLVLGMCLFAMFGIVPENDILAPRGEWRLI